MSGHGYSEDGCGSNSDCEQDGDRFICEHCGTDYCANCVDSEMSKCASCGHRICISCPEKSRGEPTATEKCDFCEIEPLCGGCYNTVDLHDEKLMEEHILCIKCSRECKKCKNMGCLNCCKNKKCCICKKDYNIMEIKKSRKSMTTINALNVQMKKFQKPKSTSVSLFISKQLKLRR